MGRWGSRLWLEGKILSLGTTLIQMLKQYNEVFLIRVRR